MKKFVSLLLLAVFILGIVSMTACSSEYVMTANEEKLEAGYYRFYVQWQRDYYKELLKNYGYDIASCFDNYYTETETVRETIISSAKSQYLSFVVVSKQFDALGLSLSADQLTELENIYQNDWVATYGEKGMKKILKTLKLSKDEFFNLISIQMKSDAILDYYYGPNGQSPITEEDKKEYYAENYVRFKYVLLSTVDDKDKALSPDQIEAKRNLANTICQRVQNGESFEELIKENSEDYTKITDKMTDAEKKEAEESNASSVNDGLISDKNGIFNQTLYTYYNISVNSAIITKLETMNVGDVAVVEIDNSVWVIKKYDLNEKDTYYSNRAQSIYEAMYGDDFNSKYTKWLAELDYSFNKETIAKLDPETFTDLFTEAYTMTDPNATN